MATTLTAGQTRRVAAASNQRITRPLGIAAVVLTLGTLLTFIGLAWDVQWHTDVGPDTFFTLPHLVLYSGTALAGIACLVAALWYAWQQRQAGQHSVLRLLGLAWGAPIGFVIAGLGAADFLVFGFYDLWWHSIYGFDVTFESPPHIGLLLGGQIMMIGATSVFAERVRRSAPPSIWAGSVLGLAAATAITLGGTIPFQEIVPPFIAPFAGYKLLAAFIYPLALLMIASVVRRPGAASLLGGVFVLLRLASWYVVLWATPAYAASLGLFMRDNILGIPDIADMMPLALLPAALLVDLVLLVARRSGLSARVGAPAAGALAGLIIAWLHQPQLLSAIELVPVLAASLPVTLLAAPLIGALAGWLGWQLGVVLGSAADRG